MDQEHQPLVSARLPAKKRFKQEVSVLATLGGPIVVTQLLQMATLVLDTMMSGQSSALDLAGVSIGGSIWMPVFLFALGVIFALTPIVAHFNGAGDFDKIAPAVHQAFWIALVAGVITWAMLFNIAPLLGLLNINREIMPVTVGYLQAISFGMPAMLGYNVLRCYADGLSLTKPAMLTSIIGLAVNAPLNYVLIYGKCGLPALGGVGCGWASAIALWISFIFMAGYVSLTRHFRHAWLFDRCYGPNWHQIKEQLKLGLPTGFMYLIEASMFSVIALFLAEFGKVVVAAHQIALNVASVVFMVPLSVGLAITIRVGFLLGAGEAVGARFSAYSGISLTLLYGTVAGLALWFFATPVVTLYTAEAAVRDLAVQLITLAALFQLADSIQVTCAGALRGYKDTKIPMLVMIVAFWMFSFPLGYTLGMTNWLGRTWEAKGFWLGLLVGLMLAAAMLSYRLYKLSQRSIAQNLALSPSAIDKTHQAPQPPAGLNPAGGER